MSVVISQSLEFQRSSQHLSQSGVADVPASSVPQVPRGTYDPGAQRLECLADERLVDVGTVHRADFEEREAPVDGATDQTLMAAAAATDENGGGPAKLGFPWCERARKSD